MSAFLVGIGVIVSLELRQRVRTVAWYVLIGVFVALVAGGVPISTFAPAVGDLEQTFLGLNAEDQP